MGGRFRHSKFFAALMAASNLRSEFMMEKRARNARVPIVRDSLILHSLDFNIYAVTNLAPVTGTHSQI